MSSLFKIDQLIDKLMDYLKVKFDLVKLDLIEEGSGFVVRLLSLFIVASLSLLVMLFAAMGLVMVLNQWLESVHVGYFIMALIFGLVLVIFLIMFKKGTLQRFLANQLLEDMENKDKNDG